jgi:hypothetical protein
VQTPRQRVGTSSNSECVQTCDLQAISAPLFLVIICLKVGWHYSIYYTHDALQQPQQPQQPQQQQQQQPQQPQQQQQQQPQQQQQQQQQQQDTGGNRAAAVAQRQQQLQQPEDVFQESLTLDCQCSPSHPHWSSQSQHWWGWLSHSAPAQ